MFLELIQQHERMWGTEDYPERPTLADLLAAPLVVMWVETLAASTPDRPAPLPRPASNGRFRLTCFTNADTLNEALLGLVTLDGQTHYAGLRIARIFANQKPAKITGIKLMIQVDGK